MKQVTRSVVVLVAAMAAAGPAAAADLFAAIAFSPSTGQTGVTSNNDSSDVAETEAYLQCGSPDCYTAVIFQQCGAVAVGDGFGMGFAEDESAAKAEETALAKCGAFTTNCVVAASACNEGF